METTEYLSHLRSDSAALAGAARDGGEAGLGTPVRACPGWDLAKLVLHVGIVHRWQGLIVGGELTEPPDTSSFPRAPEGLSRVDWLEDASRELIGALENADPASRVWSFSGPDGTALFWFRRAAQETAVHRVDAEAASGAAHPIAATLALDGIAEMAEVMFPRVARPEDEKVGTLHLHCTDLDGEWLVSMGERGVEAEPGHAKADAAVRGTASDIQLYLWGRDPLEGLEVLGDRDVARRWSELLSF